MTESHNARQNLWSSKIAIIFAAVLGGHVLFLERTIRDMMARCPGFGVIWGQMTLNLMDAALVICLFVVIVYLNIVYLSGEKPRLPVSCIRNAENRFSKIEIE